MFPQIKRLNSDPNGKYEEITFSNKEDFEIITDKKGQNYYHQKSFLCRFSKCSSWKKYKKKKCFNICLPKKFSRFFYLWVVPKLSGIQISNMHSTWHLGEKKVKGVRAKCFQIFKSLEYFFCCWDIISKVSTNHTFSHIPSNISYHLQSIRKFYLLYTNFIRNKQLAKLIFHLPIKYWKH